MPYKVELKLPWTGSESEVINRITISHFNPLQNEHQKTDGGLGAGTPMFINEVMHGAACNIL